jgi:hypothetical protein
MSEDDVGKCIIKKSGVQTKPRITMKMQRGLDMIFTNYEVEIRGL